MKQLLRNKIVQLLLMYYPFHLKTKNSKEDLVSSLSFNVANNHSYALSTVRSVFNPNRSFPKGFEGIVRSNGFGFKRLDKMFYNGILPLIKGKFISRGSSTEIKGVVRCNILVYVILGLSMLMGLLKFSLSVSQSDSLKESRDQQEEINQILEEAGVEPLPVRDIEPSSGVSLFSFGPLMIYIFLVWYTRRERNILMKNLKHWTNGKEAHSRIL